MSYVNPEHPKTRSALAAAFDLAADMFPATDEQINAQAEIYRAVASGELYDVVEALNKARRRVTQTWRNWESDFVRAVQVQICDDLRKQNRREAA